MRQPQVSKHLKVLAQAGLVKVQPRARHRIYHLDADAFEQMREWVDSFEELWAARLDSLGMKWGYKAQLDALEKLLEGERGSRPRSSAFPSAVRNDDSIEWRASRVSSSSPNPRTSARPR